jgi:prephenate dehydrogenase
MRWVNAIERNAAEHATSAEVRWPLETIEGKHCAIKEDTVVVSIPVRRINIVEALRKLNEGSIITFSLI